MINEMPTEIRKKKVVRKPGQKTWSCLQLQKHPFNKLYRVLYGDTDELLISKQ